MFCKDEKHLLLNVIFKKVFIADVEDISTAVKKDTKLNNI